ncbi:MAG: hypothetical protein DI539_10695 [Flavobacterium psychrophilum]|nr:MAG: hypothetical protein DI539_10695 [Flavobacterium psychrophilum]
MSNQSSKDDVLFHCIPVRPRGNSINPSANYGAFISDDIRKKLGVSIEEKPPLVFAATHILKAMAFGIQGLLQEKILNISFMETGGEIIIACDRAKMMSRDRDITIYEIPSKDFITLDYAERQCVSALAIPFNESKIVYEARNATDLMRGGLQIFAFNEELKDLIEEKELLKKIENPDKEIFFKILGELVNERKIIWENKEQKINPDMALARKIAVNLNQAKQNKKNMYKPR